MSAPSDALSARQVLTVRPAHRVPLALSALLYSARAFDAQPGHVVLDRLSDVLSLLVNARDEEGRPSAPCDRARWSADSRRGSLQA